MSTSQAIQAQQMHEPELLRKANVVGVAVGFKQSKGDTTGEVSVVVLVEQKKPLAALSAQDVIPSELEGMRTDVYEVGYLQAQQFQNPRERFRPTIPAGVSIGHFKVTAGTFGVLVKDKTTGEMFVLSNNHVLANSNDSAIGDAILQPGAIDGGLNPGDLVATLERFVRLRYTDEPVSAPPQQPPGPGPAPQPPTNPAPNPGQPTGCIGGVVSVVNALAALLGSQQRVTTTPLTASSVGGIALPRPVALAAAAAVPENRVDCALGRPVDPALFTNQIRQIGTVVGTKPAALGMRVRKYGRTTEYTEGNITLLNATVNIAYNTMAGQKTARFVGQIVSEAMSQGGDSGSLVVDALENKAVGLLFAGSNLATIFNPIDSVLAELNIAL
ncbi:MAG: hypothetical protein ABI835_00465 [Chloroflexota bacterium]